jgi:hypothetical protein
MEAETVGDAAARHKRSDRKLLDLFERLAPGQQDKLIAFAELLATDAPGGGKPNLIPRPQRETVTMAIRRLVRSYPMLDRRKLMAEASRLMAQHALEGRAAAGVIDDLEVVFAGHYERGKGKGKREKGR